MQEASSGTTEKSVMPTVEGQVQPSRAATAALACRPHARVCVPQVRATCAARGWAAAIAQAAVLARDLQHGEHTCGTRTRA